MKTLLCSRRRYLFPAVHFLLSFLYERSILIFRAEREAVIPIPRNNILSDRAEQLLGYAVSKLFAAVFIFFLWHLLFWILANWRMRKNLRFFVGFFAICLAGALLLWPAAFGASEDNYITYYFARRFWLECWHGAYTGCIYAALLMVVPHPVFISVFQLIFAFFVLGYLYNRIADSPVLKGRGKYCTFLIFLMPGIYKLFTNPYRTEAYALLCMYAAAMTAMDIVDQKKRGAFHLLCNILLCGLISVWRTEGIILGLLLFLVQLLSIYRYTLRKSALLFLCALLSYGIFLLPQKLSDIKYYGKDYSFINSFPVLKNILSSPHADLDYEGAEEDLAALEAVAPVELIRYYGMDGYRRYNYANGRADINQSLAEDETASAYMCAYCRILLHNLDIYAKTQAGMLLSAIMLIPNAYVVPWPEPPVRDLPPWTLLAWEIGRQDLQNTGSFMEPLIAFADRQNFSLFALNAISSAEKALEKVHWYSLLLILIPVFETLLFFREALRFVKRKKHLLGLAGIAFLLLGQAAAIALVMPAGALVYLHAYYYCSFLLCLIYVSRLRCGDVQGN